MVGGVVRTPMTHQVLVGDYQHASFKWMGKYNSCYSLSRHLSISFIGQIQNAICQDPPVDQKLLWVICNPIFMHPCLMEVGTECLVMIG